MPRARPGRYTWRDRLDDFLEALRTIAFGPVAPDERRPGLAVNVQVVGGSLRYTGGCLKGRR